LCDSRGALWLLVDSFLGGQGIGIRTNASSKTNNSDFNAASNDVVQASSAKLTRLLQAITGFCW
jgi:hypothetical protein